MLARTIPKIVNAEAPGRIARVTSILDMPFDIGTPSLPVDLKSIGGASIVLDSAVDPSSEIAVATIQSSLTVFIGKPQQTTRSRCDVPELRCLYFPATTR